MKQIPCALLVVVLALVTALAQQQPAIEYGSSQELKGVTRIYIYAGTDMSGRENIMKDIQDKLPSLVIAEKPEDAEVILEYGSSAERLFAGASSSPDGFGGVNTTPAYRKVVHGGGLVYKRTAANSMRLLLNFQDDRKSKFERRPSTNFAREFVKEYLKANK